MKRYIICLFLFSLLLFCGCAPKEPLPPLQEELPKPEITDPREYLGELVEELPELKPAVSPAEVPEAEPKETPQEAPKEDSEKAAEEIPEEDSKKAPEEIPEEPQEEAPAEIPVQPEPSSLCLPGVSVDTVIEWFTEVCLDAEFVMSGDPAFLQRWEVPIRYYVGGAPTAEDLEVLEGFVAWLNTVEGFYGMEAVETAEEANLDIWFCSEAEMIDRMGENFRGNDGGVTFWYDGNNCIYDAVICIRTEIDQTVRNSVILEEIFNGLGPIQDTELRPDSIAYAGYSTPQALTAEDELILRLLYHPDLYCGMNAEQCEAAIRELYH